MNHHRIEKTDAHGYPAQSLAALAATFRKKVTLLGGQIHEVPLRELVPKMSVRLKCQIPLCEYYGVCRVCPPNIPKVGEFKQALSEIDMAWLVVVQEQITDIAAYQHDFSAELKLSDMLLELERIGFANGFTSVMGLGVGGCKRCSECAPLEQPCRNPFKARPSPEGFGIDITRVAKKVGVVMEWPPKNVVTFLGLLLV